MNRLVEGLIAASGLDEGIEGLVGGGAVGAHFGGTEDEDLSSVRYVLKTIEDFSVARLLKMRMYGAKSPATQQFESWKRRVAHVVAYWPH